MIPTISLTSGFSRSIPRTRGDDPYMRQYLGKLVVVFHAHAGMILTDERIIEALESIPRTRGDDPSLGYGKGWNNPYSDCDSLLKSIRPKRLLYESNK